MRIAILVSSLELGGAERVAATLANAWSERGDPITLIATFSGGGRSFYPLESGVRLEFLAEAAGGRGRSLPAYLVRLFTLRRLLRAVRPDAVVSFLPNVNFMAVLASPFIGSPVLIGEGRDPGSQPASPILERLCRLSYRFADMLTVQTGNAARASLRLYGGPRRIRVIGNPLPEEIVSLQASYGTRERKILLSLGRIAPEKQVELLIDAFAAVAKNCPDWDLHLYGDGPSIPSVRQRITVHGLEGRALLMGRTGRPWRVMQDADAFVMASKFEGMPNALLEAMGIGLPCVAFDCPSGPRELSENGKYALLIPPGDVAGLSEAILKLAGDAAFGRSLGRSAREHILARYRLPVILGEWDALIREATSL